MAEAFQRACWEEMGKALLERENPRKVQMAGGCHLSSFSSSTVSSTAFLGDRMPSSLCVWLRPPFAAFLVPRLREAMAVFPADMCERTKCVQRLLERSKEYTRGPGQ